MVKINFKGLISQYKNRYRMVPVAGRVNLYDMYPERGTITQNGDEITAEAMNTMQDNMEAALLSLDIDGQRPKEEQYGSQANNL